MLLLSCLGFGVCKPDVCICSTVLCQLVQRGKVVLILIGCHKALYSPDRQSIPFFVVAFFLFFSSPFLSFVPSEVHCVIAFVMTKDHGHFLVFCACL